MSASSVPMDVVRQATSRCPPATHILAELPYLPSAVPQARRVLREGMRLADLPEDVRGTAELLVSELVTNAVKYGQPPLWLLIEMRPGLIHASVSDTSTALPQRRQAAPDAEGGRGLLVMDALAGSWGTVTAESGKYLWFDLPVPVVLQRTVAEDAEHARIAGDGERTRTARSRDDASAPLRRPASAGTADEVSPPPAEASGPSRTPTPGSAPTPASPGPSEPSGLAPRLPSSAPDRPAAGPPTALASSTSSAPPQPFGPSPSRSSSTRAGSIRSGSTRSAASRSGSDRSGVTRSTPERTITETTRSASTKTNAVIVTEIF